MDAKGYENLSNIKKIAIEKIYDLTDAECAFLLKWLDEDQDAQSVTVDQV